MLLSAIGLVFTLVAWLFTAIIRSMTSKPADSETIQLFDKEDKDK
jgi:hypothetical protein